MKKLNLVFGALVAAAAVASPAQAQVQIAGTTSGCLFTASDATCVSDLGGLTFIGGAFSVLANPNSSYLLSDLGTFSLARNATPSNSFWNDARFRLTVDITAPTDANPDSFTRSASFDADYRFTLQGFVFDDLDVDFSQTNVLINYNGSIQNEGTLFEMDVNDVWDIRRGSSQQVTGDIICGRNQCNAASVPEPSSIALLASGLFGIVGFARRRNRSA